MRIGNRTFDTDHQTYIMGILNVTPDSFSDGGCWENTESALQHVEEMIREGAAVIDVGGESTRPGYQEITESEEIKRVCTIIKEIKNRFDIPVSVDTYKPGVARQALDAGADLVNDIWGLKREPEMRKVIAEYGVPCCLMHNRASGGGDYQDFRRELLEELSESAALALEAGIRRDQILLDPGVGFAKDLSQNLAAVNLLGEIRELGYPVLLGASRKSMIGRVLELPVDEREEGTEVTTVFAVQQGCSFVRVHDVKRNQRVIRMTRALMVEGQISHESAKQTVS